ncbi:MAG: hypothetical protein EOO22_00845 [Comamonadaceae bacterium]|nr:MAG: hypothetical protein EOO22_00845 [Comamonadaceae bacterium]
MDAVLDRPSATRKNPRPATVAHTEAVPDAASATRKEPATLLLPQTSDALTLVLEQVSAVASVLIATPWSMDAGIHGSCSFLRCSLEDVEEVYELAGSPDNPAYREIQHGLALANLLNSHLDDGFMVDPTGHERHLHPIVLAIQNCSDRARQALIDGAGA